MRKFITKKIKESNLKKLVGGVDFPKTLTNCETGETLQPKYDKDANAGCDEKREVDQLRID